LGFESVAVTSGLLSAEVGSVADSGTADSVGFVSSEVEVAG